MDLVFPFFQSLSSMEDSVMDVGFFLVFGFCSCLFFFVSGSWTEAFFGRKGCGEGGSYDFHNLVVVVR